MKKEALVERLVRLGATDIPNTPRLLMKHRSPEELAHLQQGVTNAFKRVEDPIKHHVGKLVDKVPGEKVRKVLKGGANLLIDNPETIPMQAVPIPGLTPGYLGAKRLLEKGIDRFAPIPKLASLFNFEDFEELTKTATPSVGQWWEQVGGPHLAKGGSHAKFKTMMEEAGLPDNVQKKFMNMAAEKYPVGYNTRGGGGPKWEPETSSWKGPGPEPANPNYQGARSHRWSAPPDASYGEHIKHIFRSDMAGTVAAGLGAGALAAVIGHATFGKKKEDSAQAPSELRGRLGTHALSTLPLGLMGGAMGVLIGGSGTSAAAGAVLGGVGGAQLGELWLKEQQAQATKHVQRTFKRLGNNPEKLQKAMKKWENAAKDTTVQGVRNSAPSLVMAPISAVRVADLGPRAVALVLGSAAAFAQGAGLLDQYQKRLVYEKAQKQLKKAASVKNAFDESYYSGGTAAKFIKQHSSLPPFKTPSLQDPLAKTASTRLYRALESGEVSLEDLPPKLRNNVTDNERATLNDLQLSAHPTQNLMKAPDGTPGKPGAIARWQGRPRIGNDDVLSPPPHKRGDLGYAPFTEKGHHDEKMYKARSAFEERKRSMPKAPSPGFLSKNKAPLAAAAALTAAGIGYGIYRSRKQAAGAPTRGNFMMASEVPPFRQPSLQSPIGKESEMMDGYQNYGPGDFTPAKLNKKAALNPIMRAATAAKTVGTPKIRAPGAPPKKLEGVSIAGLAKPKGAGFGTGIAGAFKNTIGGDAGVSLK